MARHVFSHLFRTGLLLLLLSITATACMVPLQEPTSTALSTAIPTPSPSAPQSGDQSGAVIERAIKALAESLDKDLSAVVLLALERQDFRDAALGCPQPGEAAASVITPGYKITLGIGDAQYELHTNLDGTIVRCLPTGQPVVDIPDFSTDESEVTRPSVTAVPTPEDGVGRTEVEKIAAALAGKDYDFLKSAIPTEFWMGFYASEAGKLTRDEVLEKLKETYLGPGFVRAYPAVGVEKLLPEWTSATPYARFVYSTGWGESQKDDAILLFAEQADTLYWAGLFYIFDGLKTTAYGDLVAQLPPPPNQRLGAITDAVEGKAYETLKSLVTTPVFLGFYGSEASQLSPDAFVEVLQRDYLDSGQVKARFDVDVARLLPDWSADAFCDELLYSTGWGEDQADDGILCLKEDSGALRLSGLLYVFAHLKETAYAELPSEEEQPREHTGMVHIPSGSFLMGSSAGEVGSVQSECAGQPGCNAGQFEDETPQREVTLSAFFIDETEVTVAQFKAFVGETGYRSTSEAKGDPIQYTWRSFDTPDRQDHPVRWMSWYDANAYCQWAEKRLPTEAEWEKAARGAEGLMYPWGNTWDEARVPRGDTASVTAYPNGASPYGVLGMAGGVWEWVNDWYDPFYYRNSPTVDPQGPGETRDKVLRGGAFGNAIWKHRTAHRHFGGAEGYSHDHGFRCAKDE
jgi:formylglycine-generating enzyme required for sulfatase activity